VAKHASERTTACGTAGDSETRKFKRHWRRRGKVQGLPPNPLTYCAVAYRYGTAIGVVAYPGPPRLRDPPALHVTV